MRVRTTVSRRSETFLPRHRYLELVHLCLQYDDMKAERRAILDASVSAVQIHEGPAAPGPSQISPTEQKAIRAAELSRKIDAITRCAHAAGGPRMAPRILRSVTKEVGYDQIAAKEGGPLPVGRRTFYAMRRRFFWLLDQEV